MKYLISLLIFSIGVFAQGATLGFQCPANATAGTTITCTLVLGGGNTTTTGPTDVQGTINTSWTPGGANNVVIAGVGSITVKVIGFSASTQIFVVYGINGNQLPDGTLANITFPIPNGTNGNQTISLTSVLGATASAANFPIAANPPVNVSISGGNCDIDKNGTVNTTDVAAELNLILTKVNGDRNGDGATNVVDLRIIENAVLGLGCTASQ